jgi:hypothetical protein
MNDDYRNALIEKIHTWTHETLNDDAKLNAYIGFPAGNRYPIERIPGEKQIALDELFGVK